MKKLFFFLAALTLSFTAQAAVVNAHPNGAEANVLSWFLSQANAGDTLILGVNENDSVYIQPSSLNFDKEGLVVKAAEGTKPVIALTDEGGWTSMKVDATTTFDGVTFDGKGVTKYPVYINGTAVKKATFVNCEFKNYVKYAISDPYGGGTHVDSLIINNCYFHDGGEAVYISKYGLDGQHGCNYCEIKNSTLYNLTTSDYAGMIHVSSCGEATGAQNEVVIDHITLYNYAGSSLGGIAIRKSSNLKISNSIIANPSDKAGFYAFYIYGGTIDNTLYYNTNDDADATHTACLTDDPLFVDATNGDLTLAEGSPAIGAATDGSNLGDPRWNKVVEVEHTYTVAGSSATVFGTAWDPANADNDMKKQEDGTYKLEKTELTLAAGTIEFKVCQDHAWTVAYPGENYKLTVAEDGIYTITITFNPADQAVAATATKTGDAGKIIPTIAMHGNFLGSWADTENFTLAADEATATLTLTIAEGNYEFGVRIDGTWTSNGVAFTRENASEEIVAGSGNLTLAADVAGEYTFTWTFETNTLAITFPVVETALDNVDAVVVPTKIFKNGQILVVREGVAYDLVGRIVK
jgi:hypothetical protein